MKRKYKFVHSKIKRLVLMHIDNYFEQAGKVFPDEPELANKYVRDAYRLGMKFKVKFPSILKRRYCRNCKSYLVPSVNCRVRAYRGLIRYYCFNCKNFTRIGY